VNSRLFRQHIAMMVERMRREAEAKAQPESEVQKKPPTTAKAKKIKKTRPA
jgi:hypothetical protein